MASVAISARTSGPAYKWVVALVVIFGAFMTILDQTIVNTAIPRLQQAFAVDLHGVQWVLTAYILTQGVVTPTTGFFVNRVGAKRFYLVALALFTIGSALCGLAWNLPALIIFRIVQGIGGAFLFPLAVTLMYEVFPIAQRGLASGVLGIAALLAPAVGPTLGGYFITYIDWRLIFFVNVPVGAVGLLLGMVLLRPTPAEGTTRFDVFGFVFAALGLSAVLYALAEATSDGWTSPTVLGFAGAGVGLLLIFVVVEVLVARRGGTPLVNLRLFGNLPFLTSNITNMLITFAFFGGLFIFPLYFQELRGQNAFQSGLLSLPLAAGALLTSLIGGRLVDRIGVRPIIIPGVVLLAVSTWQFTTLTLTTSFVWVQVLLFVRGLGLGMIIQPLTVAALSDVPPPQFAQASALNAVVRFVATSLGIAVLATYVQTQAHAHVTKLVLSATSPAAARMAVPQGTMHALTDAFFLMLAVLLVAIVAAAFTGISRHAGQAEKPAVLPAE